MDTATADTGGDLDRSLVKSLNKALAIVEAVAGSERPLSISEIAILTQVPRATAHRIVQTLVSADYLRHSPVDGRVTIGLAPITVAASALDNDRLRIAALPHLQALAQEAGERSNLGCLFRSQVLYLAGAEKPSLPTIRTRFGRIVPAHTCSIGKAIAAFLPEAEVLELVKSRPLVRHTATTITTLPEFMTDLIATRKRGYAIDLAENTDGSFCIAVPIFSQANRPVAGIGLTARDIHALSPHISAVKRAAEVISHVL